MLPEPAPKSLPFVLVCDLLNELDDLVNREDYLLPRYLKERRNTAVIRWFGSHCRVLERCEKTAEHVLAMLQPTERRKDCVYGFDTEDLERIIARALHLPLEYLPELQRWRLGAPRLDLGACVEEIISKYPNKIRTCPPAQAHKTSVHDIEHALLLIACHHPESSATIRSFASYNLYSFDTTLEAGKHFRFDAASTLCILYRQLNGTQAKWLTRILLKNFGARKLFPDGLDLKATFRLPKCIEQFALPDRERPGLLSFKSILKGVDTPPPTPPIMTSNLSTMPTPISQLQKKLAPPQVSTLLPTPPTTIKKSVNSLVSLLKKRKLALSYPNINKRSVRLPVSPPPLRRSQPPVPSPILPKEDKTVSHEPSTLTKTLTKTISMPAASVNGLTSSQAADIRHSNSITINLQTNHLTCSEPKTPSLPISTQEPVLKRTQIVSKPSTNPKKYTKRMPLSSIEDNSQSQNTHVSVSSSSGAKDSVRGRPPSKSKGSGSRIRISGTGVCRLTHTKCQLANCIFLLSSCISDDPWVSDSLLAWHGSRFTKSMRAFVNLQFSAQNSQTEKNTRKIILVDTKRTLQTVDFLKRVQMQSSLSDGPKQWIEVYDWRLMEYMAKVDRGKEYTYDPWDRCKMCTI